MAKRICTVLGVVFLLVGLAGFAVPGVLGMHLSLAHNVVHLVSGAAALYLGLKGSEDAARSFCWVFGAVYLLLGLAGFVAGDGPDRMLAVIPGQLELGTVDHVVHVLFGAIFLVGGFLSRRPTVG
jgi:hypothetical protein